MTTLPRPSDSLFIWANILAWGLAAVLGIVLKVLPWVESLEPWRWEWVGRLI